jgi:hypothetical protein
MYGGDGSVVWKVLDAPEINHEARW